MPCNYFKINKESHRHQGSLLIFYALFLSGKRADLCVMPASNKILVFAR